MAGNPREHAGKKGFWDGGGAGNGMNRESGGRTAGFPGLRTPVVTGVKTDLEFPETVTGEKKSGTGAEP
jgi:hypothetical protein